MALIDSQNIKYKTIAAPSAVIIFFIFLALVASYLSSAHRSTDKWEQLIFPILISSMISALNSVLPIIVATVQTTLRDRQIDKLDNVGNEAIKSTYFYKIARANLVSIKPVSINESDYTLPIVTLACVGMFLNLISFSGLLFNVYFLVPSPILGGLHILMGNLPILYPDGDLPASIVNYQKTTFVAMVFAFQRSYISMMFRILDRVNTNDIYPITFYFYAVRMVVACLVAGIVRHVSNFFHLDTPSLIALMGFICGLSPDLMIVSISRRGFALARILAVQGEPNKSFVPTNYNLLMLKGVDRNKADRLIEMGIENSQVLSCQNPLTLWTRLPFELRLIVDWISQAQLYKYVGESGLQKLRDSGIQNARNLTRASSIPEGAHEIGKILNISSPLVDILLDNVSSDPCVTRLDEVWQSL